MSDYIPDVYEDADNEHISIEDGEGNRITFNVDEAQDLARTLQRIYDSRI